MCTAISLPSDAGYFFVRTLDLEYRHAEAVTLTPRRFRFSFTDGTSCSDHPALLGMAYVRDGYPLYYDAMNEHGLCMAGLAFAHHCTYTPTDAPAAHPIAPWELIPYTLTRCRTTEEACHQLAETALVDRPFSEELPNLPMHWIIADSTHTAVLETDDHGRLCLHDNPVGVLTNAPPFPDQLRRLDAYSDLTPHPKPNADTGIPERGMGAHGLPGDWSSPSRFARAAFLRQYGDVRSATDAFSLADSLKVPRGVSLNENGAPILTVYTAVMEPRAFRYLYQTADDPAPKTVQPTALQLRGNQYIAAPI